MEPDSIGKRTHFEKKMSKLDVTVKFIVAIRFIFILTGYALEE